MYKLYLDKSELFEAKISIRGASLTDSKCRLVLLSPDWNLVFEGEVDRDGNVEIPIKRLKNVLQEGQSGRLKLEVIVEDTYFVPWDDDFQVVLGREVTAEVKKSKKKSVKEEKASIQATVIKSVQPVKRKGKQPKKTSSLSLERALRTVVERKYPKLKGPVKEGLVKKLKQHIDGRELI